MVGPDIEENDVKQFARASQPFFPNILFGHPARIQNVVQNGQLELRSVSLFVMDDTADMLAKDLSTDVFFSDIIINFKFPLFVLIF